MFRIIITAPRSAQPNPLTSGRKEAATQRRERERPPPATEFSDSGKTGVQLYPLCKWDSALIRSIFKSAKQRKTLASSPNERALLKLRLNMPSRDENEK